MTMESVNGKKAETKGQGLIDLVFSWPLADVLNKNLYLGKVGKIPRTFSCTAGYMKSFIQPLIEETHADLLSALETVDRAPMREILDIKLAKGFKAPKDLYYQILLKGILTESSNRTDQGNYEPESGDLIALTDVKPTCAADLNRPKRPYLVALVVRRNELEPDKLLILSSKPVVFDEDDDGTKKKKTTLFAVYLSNMTTNVRIWTSLKSELEGGNTNIIKRVLQTDCNVGKNCTQCLSQGNRSAALSIAFNTISSFKLDNSQKAAVLSCVATRECCHQNSVKLIGGPPGTGKTKTVSSLLVVLLRLRCRTLTCAPTNIAVLGVAKRLMSLVSQGLKYDSYGLGDIVLFGNGDRMKIDDHKDLYDVFLDYRASVLKHCFAPLTGWKCSLESMICLLEDPEELYRLYLEEERQEEEGDEGNSNESEEGDDIRQMDKQEILRRAIPKNLKENKKKEKQNKEGTSQSGKSHGEKPKIQLTFEELFWKLFKSIGNQLSFFVTSLYTHMPTSLVSLELAKKMIRAFGRLKSIGTSLLRVAKNEGNSNEWEEGDDIRQMDRKEILRRAIAKNLKENKKKEKQNKEGTSRSGKSHGEKPKIQLTFEEFFWKRFNFIGNQLSFCVTSLYTHMPTSLVSLELAKKMIRAFGLVKSIRTSLLRVAKNEDGIKSFVKSNSADTECLQILKFLRDNFSVPTFTDHYLIQNFCLENASLIFCTASSSSKLHTVGTKAPVELLVVDEAAQLKECESTIPLQLSGLRHAILIGDERQLPAMVQSKICQNVRFGRSLFERLVELGHEKHLLNVQYRMHPSISLFPNSEFYDRRILDGPNVKERTYEKRFLEGRMYGPFSFINVAQSKETQDSRRSTQNMVEVAVLAEIVATLYKESMASKQKVRVGCISPYKAQVFAIQEKLGKTYSSDAKSNFSVSVRSVDGFQGGEEDLIIISTVRSNLKGSVGFLENRQRANVALTRARHCLWILGNGPTLVNSGTVWKKLVLDAQARGCFYNATDEKNLAKAVAGALVELNQFDPLLRADSLLFRNARWKVSFSDQFVESMTRIKNVEIRKQVVSLLEEISSGWCQNQNDRIPNANGNISSQMLELRKINGSLNLIWSVDVAQENSEDVQVLRVWDVLLSTEISRLATRLDTFFKNYTVETMNRCISRKLEGNLVVPLSWPAGSSAGSNSMVDYVRFSQSQLASLSLKPEPGSSNNRNGDDSG